MKKLYYILLLIMLVSCQVIPEQERLIPMEFDTPQSRALITEFTGFRCVNCPKAAEQAHLLLETYPENLIVVEMHPKSNTFCQTSNPKYDLTCPEADVYYTALGGVVTTPFPTGVVDWSSGLQDYENWPALVAKSIFSQKIGALQLSAQWQQKRDLQVTYSIAANSSDAKRNGEQIDLRLLLWLVQDSIVAPQMMPDGSATNDYAHNHVLRASLFDDPFGEEYNVLINSEITTSTLGYAVPDSVNGQAIDMAHCSIVGVLLDSQKSAVQDVVQVPITMTNH